MNGASWAPDKNSPSMRRPRPPPSTHPAGQAARQRVVPPGLALGVSPDVRADRPRRGPRRPDRDCALALAETPHREPNPTRARNLGTPDRLAPVPPTHVPAPRHRPRQRTGSIPLARGAPLRPPRRDIEMSSGDGSNVGGSGHAQEHTQRPCTSPLPSASPPSQRQPRGRRDHPRETTIPSRRRAGTSSPTRTLASSLPSASLGSCHLLR